MGIIKFIKTDVTDCIENLFLPRASLGSVWTFWHVSSGGGGGVGTQYAAYRADIRSNFVLLSLFFILDLKFYLFAPK